MADVPKNKTVDVTIRAKTAGFEEVSQKVKNLNDQASRAPDPVSKQTDPARLAELRRKYSDRIATWEANAARFEATEARKRQVHNSLNTADLRYFQPYGRTLPPDADIRGRMERELQTRLNHARKAELDALRADIDARSRQRRGPLGLFGGGGGVVGGGFGTGPTGAGNVGGSGGGGGGGGGGKDDAISGREMRVRQRGIVQMSALAYASSTLAMSFMDVDGATNKMVRGMQSAAMSMQIVGGITGGKFGGGMIVAGGIMSIVAMAVAAIKGQEAREALNLLGRNNEKDDELEHLKSLIAKRNLAPAGSARSRLLDDEINAYAQGVQSRDRIAEERQKAEGYIAANRTPEEAAQKEVSEMRELARQMRSQALAPNNAVEQGMSATLLKESNQLFQAANRRLEEISGNTKSWKDFAWEIIGANSNSVRPISLGEMRRATPTMQGLTINVPGDGYLAQMASSIAHQVNEYYLRQLYPNMAG